jgi:maltodextrin utilization protein YvdJ
MWKEKLLGQRSNFAYWSPLVLIIFLITLHTTAFAGVMFSNSSSEMDNEIKSRSEYYTDTIIETKQSGETFGENNSSHFGGEYSQSYSYKQLAGPAFAETADTLDG